MKRYPGVLDIQPSSRCVSDTGGTNRNFMFQLYDGGAKNSRAPPMFVEAAARLEDWPMHLAAAVNCARKPENHGGLMALASRPTSDGGVPRMAREARLREEKRRFSRA